MNKILVVTLALSLQSTTAAANQEARGLVRCERAGGYVCTHPDDPNIPWEGCIETESDGRYLLIPRLGYAGLVPLWEDADQEELRMLLTYERCRSDGTCDEIEVRAERHLSRDVRLVGQSSSRDYSLELRAAFRATDPPILATEVERFLGAVNVLFWNCPATLVHLR